MRPLRVAITQEAEDGRRMAGLLRDQGFTPVPLPQLRFAPTNSPVPAGPFDLLLLTSPRALAFLLEAPGGVPRVGRVLAVGARTLDLARQAGLPVDPEVHPGSGLALARCVPAAPPALRLLVPRGNVARDEAVEALKAAGHVVEAPVLYRTEPVEYAPEQVAALQGDPPEVVLFASPSAFRHFLAAFGREVLERAHIGVIGPTTRAEVEASGFTVKLMPARPELSELAAELRRFHDGDSGSPLP